MDPSRLQAALFEFAITDLVRRHRDSFQPRWSAESWAKLLIWLALNCGCSGDQDSLRAFAEALGPALSGRLRHTFFERELEALALKLLADPSEALVLVMPLEPGVSLPAQALVEAALAAEGLGDRLVPVDQWQQLEGLLAIPWSRV